MENNIKEIQNKLMKELQRLDNATKEETFQEVARSNALSQLANTYIKSWNLIIRTEEAKLNIRKDLMSNEK